MSTHRLLPAPEIHEAQPVEDDLRARVETLEKEVAGLHARLDDDRKQIGALLKSARIVFGGASSSAPAAASPVESDKWDRLKAKLGGKMAEIIEALQLTGVATRTQLKNQTGGALGTIDQAVYKLRDMGLLVKNGDGWSLKN